VPDHPRSGDRRDDEVITITFGSISSANCILYEQAKPVFVDIGEEKRDRYCIDCQVASSTGRR